MTISSAPGYFNGWAFSLVGNHVRGADLSKSGVKNDKAIAK